MFEGLENIRQLADAGDPQACIQVGDALMERSPYNSPPWEKDSTLANLLTDVGYANLRATDAFEYANYATRLTGDVERVMKGYESWEGSVRSSQVAVELRKEELGRDTPGRADYLKAAFHYFHKAADMGDPAAMCRLGWRYRLGQGTNADHGQAVCWWRRAAESGDTSAQGLLRYGDP